MKCPNCQKSTLTLKTLSPDLQVLECSECGGYWIQSFQYWNWKEKNPNVIASTVESNVISVSDSTKPKRCPECNKSLNRYMVGKGTKINIERCETCRGFWFDKNEWELLESKNIASEVHKIFSLQWQKEVRSETIKENRAQAFTREIGKDDFDKVEDFRKWLDANPRKQAILTFLNYMS